VKRRIKSQAAMEYLMTYGWAILIIALTLAVLYSLGIMNPKNFLPRAPPGSCFVFRPNGPGTTDFVSLQGTCGYLPMYVGSFDGVNGYVKVPASTSINTIKTGLTISYWVKRTKDSGGYHVIRQSSFGGLKDLGGNSYGFWTNHITGSNYLVFSTNTIPIGSFHFVTLVWAPGIKKVYVDANLVIQNLSVTANLSISDTVPLYVGNSQGWHAYNFSGILANVQIYNTALTPQEIQYLYQQGLGGGPVRLQNLVGWWPLNGDAKDYSGNNNHGTISGGVTFVQNYNPP
jgi:hypothetical protein